MREWSEVVPDAQKFDRAIGTAMAVTVSHTVSVVVQAMRKEHRWRDRTGATRESITGEVKATTKGASGLIRAGENAIRLNDGTPPHVIRARRAKALRFVGGGFPIFRKEVNHPGTAPDPFLYQAEQKAEEEFFGFFDELFDELLDG